MAKFNDQTVLITGGAGYIGSVLCNLALQSGLKVRVVDKLWFNEQIPLIHLNNPAYTFYRGDIGDRNLMRTATRGCDYIIHLAAIVGDPASNLFPDLTQQVNHEASLQLISIARENGVKGFVFFSTCSNYGISDGLATEDSALNPLSLYARTKVDVERHLRDEVKGLDWIIGRLSTVYGSSPRMRFDLTVNDFTLNAWKHKHLKLFLPKSYRPYIHTYDLSNIILQLLSQFEAVRNNVFNIGFEGENYQKIEIAETIARYVPDLRIEILKEGGDRRDYQVDFSKLHSAISVSQTHDVEASVKELLQALELGMFSNPGEQRYYNTTPRL